MHGPRSSPFSDRGAPAMSKDHAIKMGWLRPVEIRWRRKDKDGYWLIHVVNHPIVGSRRIAEHRLVMIEKLGRKLRRNEHVHHDKCRRITYNAPSNLTILTPGDHVALHNKERQVSKKTRNRMRKRMLGNKLLLGHKHTRKTIEKMRRSHIGVPKGPPSLQTRLKISAGLRRHHGD